MKITEFDWNTVPDEAVMIYIGRRKSGKTTNIIDTFYKKRKAFKMGLIFCGSKSTIKEYEDHFPSSFIYYGYDSTVLGKVIDKQETDVELGVAKPIFILVDDCMWAKKSILGDPNIRRVFMNGRHSKIFFCLSMQYCMDLHPALRQQIDYTFLSREKNPQNRDRLYKNYNVCFRDAPQFDNTMMQCTLDFETMVLNNGSTESDQPEDNVFWWKAKYVPGGRKFRVNKRGSWWKYHKKKYNPRHFIKDETAPGGTRSPGMMITKVKTAKRRRKPPPPALVHGQRLCPVPQSSNTPNAQAWLQRQRQQNLGPRKPLSTIREVDKGVKYIT
jgi:hypothetical protein